MRHDRLTVAEAVTLVRTYEPTSTLNDRALRARFRRGSVESFADDGKRYTSADALVRAELLPFRALEDLQGITTQAPDFVPEDMLTASVAPSGASDGEHTPARPRPTVPRSLEHLIEGDEDAPADALPVADEPRADMVQAATAPTEPEVSTAQPTQPSQDTGWDDGMDDLVPLVEPTPAAAGRAQRPARPRQQRTRRPVRARLAATVVAIVAVGGAGVAVASSGSSTPGDVAPVARTVAPTPEQVIGQRVDVLARGGDYDRAIMLAAELPSETRAGALRAQAAGLLMDRAEKAIAADKLDTARRYLSRSKDKYGDAQPERAAELYAALHAKEAAIAKVRAAATAKRRAAALRAKRRAAAKARRSARRAAVGPSRSAPAAPSPTPPQSVAPSSASTPYRAPAPTSTVSPNQTPSAGERRPAQPTPTPRTPAPKSDDYELPPAPAPAAAE